MTKIERELERLQTSIADICSGLKVEVVKILESDLANPRPTAVMRSINAAIDRTRTRARAWMDEAIPGPLQMKSRELAVKFNVLGFRPPGKRTALIKTQEKLRERLSDYLEKAHTRIRDSASRFVMLSQRMKKTAAKFQAFAIEDVESAYAKFEELAGIAAREMWSRIRLQKSMKEFLLGEIEGDNFITVNGRNYGIRDYTEMVARTELAEAQTDYTKAECAEHGADLVIFSSHAEACAECAEWEGQVFSLSGTHPDYPELTDEVTPPIHPNCGHGIDPTSEEAMAFG